MSEKEADAESIGKFLHELDIRIRARYPLIAINTFEEDRVREALVDLVFKERHKEKPLYFWSAPTGLQKIVDPKDGIEQTPATVGDTKDPESVLGFIGEQKTGIFLLCDYAPFISPYGREDPLLVRRLRELAWKLKSTKATVLFVGPSFPDLKTLEKEITQIELELPKETEIEESIELQLETLRSSGLAIDLTKETQDALLQSLLGLSAGEISNVIAKAVISCNGLNHDSISVILEEKKNVIRGSGSLTYVHPEPASNLGGYKSLRAILERAAYTFSLRAKARRVEPCKGILLVGLPGCGKDLCKRVASSITNRALLDLDFGSIMGEGGGVIGSSAMSIKRALDGVLEAFIDGDRRAETRDILKAVDCMTPTAQMMSEKIEEIRKWARNNIKGVGMRIDNSGIAGNRGDRIYEL